MVVITEKEFKSIIDTIAGFIQEGQTYDNILKGYSVLTTYKNYIVRCGENETDNNHYHHSTGSNGL